MIIFRNNRIIALRASKRPIRHVDSTIGSKTFHLPLVSNMLVTHDLGRRSEVDLFIRNGRRS